MDNTLVPSKHQAAGHDGCLISIGDNSIFAKLTNQQEIDFYNETQLLSQDDEDQPLGSKLIDWMPVFMGTLTQSDITKHDPNSLIMPVLNEDKKRVEQKLEGIDKDSEDDKQYIVLQNLYGGYVSPSILDVKLGSKLFDENATAEKAERLGKVSDTTTSGTLNFRICGMKLYNGSLKRMPADMFDGMEKTMKLIPDDDGNANYIEFDKYFGRSLSKDNVADGLALFFDQFDNAFIKRKLLETFLKRLQLLYNCLLDTEVRIISGSLLFTVENDTHKWEPVVDNDELYESRDSLIRSDFIDEDDNDDDDDNPDEGQGDQCTNDASHLSSLNFIDFAHAKYTKGKGYDENIILGVENLIAIFETILNQCK